MSSPDVKRVNRTVMVYRVVQVALLALLGYMAFNFQRLFALRGRPDQFITSIVVAIVVQVLIIYPVYRLAWRDAGIEIEGSVPGLSGEQVAALRRKRLMGDLWKSCAVIFFLTFVVLAPDQTKTKAAPLVLSGILFSFLFACLAYFQCFNFSVRKRMKQGL
ncbi:hypothetical protein FO488_16600 [Geobacter sp. FeAm09]|uniref:hypothetical protein n=1 Tax=Geobacter sp. FeAm09 TaxID=2597769 RepID=UPI0011EE1900|nr:hypothetical protein [Geobacter sp. FeAm09]QEM69610.1 hypothetical protein FO488_16600 [Geobacter sp. FeAm09]